ncbi:MAG: nitroreductase family protein [Thermoguttaceae bacterium]
MELFDAIRQRHSYRGEFTDAAVPRSDLEKIVQAAIDAPSGCNAQTTSFVIVDDADCLRQIAEIVDKPYCRAAKAMIACVTDPRPAYGNCSFAAEDCAAAVENMLLAITALGYATVWLDGVLRAEDRAARIGRLLGVPSDKNVRVLLPIGVPSQHTQPREKQPFSQRAWFNRFGGA